MLNFLSYNYLYLIVFKMLHVNKIIINNTQFKNCVLQLFSSKTFNLHLIISSNDSRASITLCVKPWPLGWFCKLGRNVQSALKGPRAYIIQTTHYIVLQFLSFQKHLL